MQSILVAVMKSMMITSTPTAVDVKLILLERSVRQRLMIVIKIPVRTMALVKMESTLTHVTAKKGSLLTSVKFTTNKKISGYVSQFVKQ